MRDVNMKIVNKRRCNDEKKACVINIMNFFGISQEAATFLYHRKRRSYPFKKRSDPKFLEWTLSLQNALIKADKCVDWDWDALKFGLEEQILLQHDIWIEAQSNTKIFKNVKKEKEKEKEKENDEGWTIVKDAKKIKQHQNKSLKMLGFIPKLFNSHS
jgi:hypothetical protein